MIGVSNMDMVYTEDDVLRIADVLWADRGFTSITKNLQNSEWNRVLSEVELTLQTFGAVKQAL